jgi:hypothetical protein
MKAIHKFHLTQWKKRDNILVTQKRGVCFLFYCNTMGGFSDEKSIACDTSYALSDPTLA